jgi:alpha-L-fucosidase 2
MKESALFYEDFLVIDENGMLKSYPADSPENRPNGTFKGAGEISVCINPTMDFALIKELLTNLVASATTLGIDADSVAKWKGMLEKIPPYEINEDGAIKEWLHDDFKDNYHHRHQSHIYPLFPGLEIDSDSGKLFEATRIAVNKRLVIGLKAQTGWSLAHMANIFARLNDAQGAQHCLDLLIRFCTGPNLYTYHNDWRNMGVTLKFIHGDKPPFQIDANMGFASAVYEMLLYSGLDKITLLPALPKKWEKGSVSGLRTRTGAVVDIAWDKDKVSATLTALYDTTFKVRVKDGEYTQITLKKGEKYVI